MIRSRVHKDAPFPVIAGLRPLKFATIRRPIMYSGNSGVVMFDAGRDTAERIGPVPRLAIAQTLRGEREFFLLHCKRTWEVRGLQGPFRKSAQAEETAERIYPGVSAAWVTTEIKIREAKEFERVIWHKHSCSFCGRIPPELEDPSAEVITVRDARICSDCIREFYRQLK